MFGWFRRDEDSPAVNPANILAPKPFHEQMIDWIDDLDWFERESSGFISTNVFSRLRVINDLLSDVNEFIKRYNIRAEEEYIIKSTITQYIPDALNIFNQLPAHDRAPGSEADRMLLDQCDNIERSIRQLNTDMHNRVKSELATQTQFVEDRFSHQV